MPTDVKIDNAPNDVVRRLRERAGQQHRSLQGESPAIIKKAITERRRCSPGELLAEVRLLGLCAPTESVGIVRACRDASGDHNTSHAET